jgi:undecaprenyl-diphosphatase
LAGLFLAIAVQLGLLNGLDLRLLHAAQRRSSPLLDDAVTLVTWLGGAEVTLLLAAALTWPIFKGLRLLAVLPLITVAFGTVVEWIGKNIVHQPAPASSYLRLAQWTSGPMHQVTPYSFPSGHVLRSTILYGLVFYLARRWELFGKESSRLSPILIGLIGLMALAVVYLGWHWPSDAVGGLLLGLAVLFGLIAYLERKRLSNPGHLAD